MWDNYAQFKLLVGEFSSCFRPSRFIEPVLDHSVFVSGHVT